MKLSVAVGILSQTLPVVSETTLSAWLDSRRRSNGRSLDANDELSTILSSGGASSRIKPGRALKRSETHFKDRKKSRQFQSKTAGTRKLKNTSSSMNSVENLCDPFSSDPDTGILSCGKGRRCQPSKTSALGGECTDVGTRPSLMNPGAWWRNPHGKGDKAVECVPNMEADIGILECGSGQICVESAESSLGGICSSPTTSRQLQIAFHSGLCDPESFAFGRYECDCSAFNNVTKTGDVQCQTKSTCLGSEFYGCYDTCQNTTETYSFQNNNLRFWEECNEFVVKGDAETSTTLCLKIRPGDNSCEAELDGQACSSCTVEYPYGMSFDCTNVDNGFSMDAGRYLTLTSLPVIQACYQPVNGEYCALCSEASYIRYEDTTPSSLGGFGDSFTCSGLLLANLYNQISTEKCPDASAVAKAACCVYTCNICAYRSLDNVTAYDPLYVEGFGETTCSEVYFSGLLNTSITEESCPLLRRAIGDACCTGVYGYFCDICGTTGTYIAYENFDLMVYAPGLGNVTCGNISSLANPFSVNGLDAETCPVVAASVNGTCCTEFVPFCYSLCGYNGYAILPSLFNTTVNVPGLGNYTCYELYSAMHYGGNFDSLSNDTCALQEAGSTSCCRPYSISCHVCGLGKDFSNRKDVIAFTDPSIGTLTCYDVGYGSYVDGSIANETCSLIQGLVVETCCVPRGPYSSCSICGDDGDKNNSRFGGIVFPWETILVYEGGGGYPFLCGSLGYSAEAGYLNETGCAYFSSVAAGPCCGVGSMLPSAAPVGEQS